MPTPKSVQGGRRQHEPTPKKGEFRTSQSESIGSSRLPSQAKSVPKSAQGSKLDQVSQLASQAKSAQVNDQTNPAQPASHAKAIQASRTHSPNHAKSEKVMSSQLTSHAKTAQVSLNQILGKLQCNQMCAPKLGQVSASQRPRHPKSDPLKPSEFSSQSKSNSKLIHVKPLFRVSLPPSQLHSPPKLAALNNLQYDKLSDGAQARLRLLAFV